MLPATTGPALIFGLLFILSACSNDRPERRRTVSYIDLPVDTTLTIGDREEGPIEYLFSSPEDIAVDSAGHIYVADEGMSEVRKYSMEGEFMTAIGSGGRGPGEFQYMHDLLITSDDELIIVGTHNISWFTLEGEHLGTHKMEDLHRKVLEISENRYLLIDHDINQKDSLFHVRTSDLVRLKSFAPVSQYVNYDLEFADDTDFEDTMLRDAPGSALWLDSGQLLYTPFIYDGRIRVYTETADGWQSTDTLQGYIHQEQIYEKVPPGKKASVVSGKFEYGYDYNSTSLGLHQIEDGRIFHFTAIDSAHYRTFGVEIYRPNGELIGYSPITQAFDEDGRPMRRFPYVRAYGGDGEFYLLTRGWWDYIPKIERLSIQIRDVPSEN